MAARKLRLAVLISGTGTTLQNLINRSKRGELAAEVVVVVSSRAKALGLKRARRHGIPAFCIARNRFSSPDQFSKAVYDTLASFQPDLIVLAGFLHLLRVPQKWEGRIINIHPALLPSFGGKGMYGLHVHKAVLREGVKITGATVHFVDEHYDTGPIILQAPVWVRPNDTPATLQARVQAMERELLPAAINLIARGKVKLKARRVTVTENLTALARKLAEFSY